MDHMTFPDLFHSLFCVRDIITPGENSERISTLFEPSRHCVEAVVTRLRTGRPKNLGSILESGKGFTSSPKPSDRLYGPPSLLFNGQW